MRTLIPLDRLDLITDKLNEVQLGCSENLLAHGMLHEAMLSAVARLTGVPMISWSDLQVVVDPYRSTNREGFSTVAVLEYIPTVNYWGLVDVYRDRVQLGTSEVDDAQEEIRVRPQSLGDVLMSYVTILDKHGIRVSGLSDNALTDLLVQVRGLVDGTCLATAGTK